MTTVTQEVLSEAKKNKYSNIWNVLTDSEVIGVWDSVAAFVKKNMDQQKAVSIPGLGTFTFTQTRLDVGNKKFVLSQRPVFVLSEKLVQTHALRQKKYTVPGGLPVLPLNLASLSMDSNGAYTRDTIDGCVRQVLGALSRCVAANRPVEFTFNGIGRLQIRDSRVKMKFFKNFVQQFDGSGKLVESLQGRPTTADSVMSEYPMSARDRSTSALALPRGVCCDDPDSQRAALPAISEDGEEEQADTARDDRKKDTEADVMVVDRNGKDGVPLACVVEDDDECANKTCTCTAENMRKTSPDANKGRTLLPVPSVTAVSLTEDDLLMAPAHDPLPPPRLPQSTGRASLTARESDRSPSYARQYNGNGHAATARSLDSGTPGFDRLHTPPSTAGSCISSCGHSDAGQELCYLCHQRAQRNVYVSFAEERRRREEEEDQLLHDFLRQRDSEEFQREQEKLLERRHETQKTAQFNLTVASDVAAAKAVKDDEFHPSFVFRHRAVTPPQFLKQDRYQKQLEEQMALKEETEKKKKLDEEYLGRLEQVQLAEDIAAQREKFLKQKAERMESYKRALSAQVEMKTKKESELPPLSPEPLYFATDVEARDEAIAEKRRRANELFREQVALVEQRKREAILKRLDQQQKEKEMLARNKQEMLVDAADRYERLVNNRRKLEDDWLRTADRKREADDAERRHRLEPSQLQVLEQCDNYRRCGQCRRRLTNRGQTNVWKETRYTPGCRIMV